MSVKNSRLKALQSIFSCRAIVLLMAIFLILPLVSAWEWDNVKSYDPQTKTATITNALGLGRELAKVRLDTPDLVYVMPGNDRKVAEITIENLDTSQTLESFSKMEFISLNSDNRIIRKWTYKLRVLDGYRDVSINPKQWCDSNTTGIYNCYADGKTGIKSIPSYSWVEIKDLIDIKPGDIIGLFTDVENGDYVEWIPEIFGIKINEWATWTASFNTDLMGYWTLNESATTTNALESVEGKFNGTLGGDGSEWKTGLIGNSFYAIDSSSYAVIVKDGRWSCLSSCAFNFWMNTTDASTASNQHMFAYWVGSKGWDSKIRNGGQGLDVTFGGTTANYPINPTIENVWVMFTGVYNGTDVLLYVNGTFVASTSGTIGTEQTDLNINIGRAPDGGGVELYTGLIDELGFWNRTLSDSEISDLYNNGAGLTYDGNPQNPITLSLEIPADNYITNITPITFNCSANGTNLLSLTLIVDDADNLTIVNVTDNENLSLQSSLSMTQGAHNWSCYSTDSSHSVYSTTRSLTYDSITPSITINLPLNQSYLDELIYQDTKEIELNWTISDTNLDSCWINNGTDTRVLTCGDNTSTYNITYNQFNSIKFYANDTIGNENYIETNPSYNYTIKVNERIYNATSQELKEEGFGINITYDSAQWTLLSPTINYNGTDYSAVNSESGNTIFISKSLDTPLLAETTAQNLGFYWSLGLTNTSGTFYYNTTELTQSVNPIKMGNCSGDYGIPIINFTAYDEQTRANLDGFHFKGTFEYSSGSTQFKNVSFDETDLKDKAICVNESLDYTIRALVEYSANETGYTTRNYYIYNEIFNDSMTNIKLFSLNSSDATSFILQVIDKNQQEVEGAYIYTEKYFPELNDYDIVQVALTDSNGKSIGFFETEIVDYRFTIKRNGVTELVTSKRKVVPEAAPYTITLTIGADSTTPWADFDELGDLDSSLTFNETTNLTIYTYIDTSGNFTLGRLVVEEIFYNGTNRVICNTTSASTSAALTCDVSSYSGDFIATGYITRGSTESADSRITFNISDAETLFGLYGVLLAFFIILVAGCCFFWNHIAGIVGINAAVILVNLIGLVSFSGLFIFGMIAVSVILLFIWRT